MVMKFVKCSFCALTLPMLLVAGGCATQTKKVEEKEQAPIAAFIAKKEAEQREKNKPEEPVVVEKKVETPPSGDSTDYLPVQAYDELGNKIDYVKAVNPYEATDVVIRRESVEAFIQARRDFKAKQYDKAYKKLQQLIKKDESLSGPYVLMAKIAVEKKQLKEAIAHYEKALAVNSNNVNAYLGLAKVQRMQGQFKAAQNTYINVLHIWKDFPEAHANLAILYDVYLNKPKLAQKHMEASVFLSPRKNENLVQWLAEIKQRTGITKSFIDNPPQIEKVVEASETVAPQAQNVSQGEES